MFSLGSRTNHSNPSFLNLYGISGKSSKHAKAKSSKKSGEKETTPKKRAEFIISRNNPLLNGDSKDESIGTELPFTSDSVAKFSSNVNPIIKSMLKPRELLTPEYHSLCDDLSNLILLSSSRQTWAKHCSAWRLFSEFCSIFRISFDLPIKTESSRAFVTWAASTKT